MFSGTLSSHRPSLPTPVPAAILLRARKQGAASSGAERVPSSGRGRSRPRVVFSFRRCWGIAALLAVLVGTLAPPLNLASGLSERALIRRPRMEPRTAAAALHVPRRALLRERAPTPLHWQVGWLASDSRRGPAAVIRRRQRHHPPYLALLSLGAPPPPSSRAPPTA